MHKYVRVILVILGIAVFFWADSLDKKVEQFQLLSDNESETIRKLKEKMKSGSFETKTRVAYNDVGAFRTESSRPINNISAKVVSEVQGLYPVEFRNTYFDLWEKEKAQLINSLPPVQKKCIPYKNINQCMSVCSANNKYTGFYVDKPGVNTYPFGVCCMLEDPPFTAGRHAYDHFPSNLETNNHRDIANVARRQKETAGKVVFDYIRTDGGNGTYKTDLNRDQCNKLCPKCVSGSCPTNYRCSSMLSDPRFNDSCIITNEDKYNENDPTKLFDSDNIPYLYDGYNFDEYKTNVDLDKNRSFWTVLQDI